MTYDWFQENYWIVTSATCEAGNVHSFRNIWFQSLMEFMISPIHYTYIHYIICQVWDYVFGWITCLCAWINLTALSRTYFIHQRYKECQYTLDAGRGYQAYRLWMCQEASPEDESQWKSSSKVSQGDAILDGTGSDQWKRTWEEIRYLVRYCLGALCFFSFNIYLSNCSVFSVFRHVFVGPIITWHTCAFW